MCPVQSECSTQFDLTQDRTQLSSQELQTLSPSPLSQSPHPLCSPPFPPRAALLHRKQHPATRSPSYRPWHVSGQCSASFFAIPGSSWCLQEACSQCLPPRLNQQEEPLATNSVLASGWSYMNPLCEIRAVLDEADRGIGFLILIIGENVAAALYIRLTLRPVTKLDGFNDRSGASHQHQGPKMDKSSLTIFFWKIWRRQWKDRDLGSWVSLWHNVFFRPRHRKTSKTDMHFFYLGFLFFNEKYYIMKKVRQTSFSLNKLW